MEGMSCFLGIVQKKLFSGKYRKWTCLMSCLMGLNDEDGGVTVLSRMRSSLALTSHLIL